MHNAEELRQILAKNTLAKRVREVVENLHFCEEICPDKIDEDVLEILLALGFKIKKDDNEKV